MINTREIPHLKLFKYKTLAPITKSSRTHGLCTILNTPTLDESIKLIKNNKYIDKSKTISYYTQTHYRGKIGTKVYNKNLTRERLESYNKIKQNIPEVNTYLSESAINKRNVYLDMYNINTLFFDLTSEFEYRRKVKLYIEILKAELNNPFKLSYENSMMIIDLTSWNNKVSSTNGVKNFNNPITILYYTMRKMFDEFKSLGNNDIIIQSQGGIIRLNPSLCDEKSFNLFKIELFKLDKKMVPLEENDEIMEKEIDKNNITDAITSNLIDKYNLTGDEDNIEIEEEIKDMAEEELSASDILDKGEELDLTKIDDKLKEKIEQNKELLKKVDNNIKSTASGKTSASLKRDEELRKREQDLTLHDAKLTDITSRAIPKMVSENVARNVQTTNANIVDVKFPNFEKSYNETLYEKDIVGIFTDLADKSLPMYIIDIQKEDSSNELYFKETYTVKFEDANRQRHTIKVDLPKFIDDKFMYLNGNKKIIIKQQIMKPVVKTNQDTVQIVTNYNKMFLRRYGEKVSEDSEQLRKVIVTNPISGVSYKTGDASSINVKYHSSLEYDYLSKSLDMIETKFHKFIFNQDTLNDIIINTKQVKPKDCWMPIGIDKSNNSIIWLTNNQLVKGTDLQLIDFIVESIDKTKPGSKDEIQSTSAGKRFMYTRAKIMKREVPLIILIAFFEGLSTILRKSEIPHYFTDKNPSAILNGKQDYIRFSDGYLVYDKYPIDNSLLLNGLKIIDTKSFEYGDFDDRETYIAIFDELYNARALGKYFLNTYESMIDNITREVLETLNYPTDLCGLLIFANRLLSDNSYLSEVNMNLYRIRSNEIIAALLYKTVADEYNNYRNIAMTSSNRKMSIKQDAVITKLMTSQIVEDYSTLNPISELEKSRATTPKGPSGLNVSRAYTQEKRSYDKSMLGLMAISTSPKYIGRI